MKFEFCVCPIVVNFCEYLFFPGSCICKFDMLKTIRRFLNYFGISWHFDFVVQPKYYISLSDQNTTIHEILISQFWFSCIIYSQSFNEQRIVFSRLTNIRILEISFKKQITTLMLDLVH